jgi:hypothetical protein
MKKILTSAVILLFIGVAIAPSINQSVVKASHDDDLVEVTTQACGIQGYGNTTVRLTKEQYQDLEQYLVEFQARLNQTTTREEAVPIFKEAVVELNKYGLLPKGMSVERAQRFIINSNQNKREINAFTRMNHYLQTLSIGSIDNACCLIAGKCYNVYFVRILFNNVCVRIIDLFDMLYEHYEFLSKQFLFNLIVGLFIDFYFYVVQILSLYSLMNLGIGIYFGSDSGGIITIGLFGLDYWSGSINGGFEKFPAIPDDCFLGVIGFTGFHITIINLYEHFVESFLLGSALAVGLEN